MKELTIEEKAQRYDEAIKIAREINNEQRAQPFNVMTRVFPELKESEDERIRKEILDYLSTVDDKELIPCGSWVAWLEKQGEQKPADKVEPKFKVGDWILYSGDHYEGVRHITKIDENGYYIERNGLPHGIIPFNHEICMRLWTIKDAKDGDVLATLNHILIFEAIISKDGGVSYCHYNFGSSRPQFDFNKDDNWYFGKEAKVYPATKEQHDTLMKAMTDAGYTFDFKKKELKKIEQKSVAYVPKFHVGDKLISTKNPSLNYEVLEVGHINELDNLEYKVEIFTNGKAENPRNIHYIECHKLDEWAELIKQRFL